MLNAVLRDGDQVEQVLVGQYHGLDGAIALVGPEVLLVNAREWDPEVVRLPVAGLTVQGQADGRNASLHFQGAGVESFSGVADTELAVEFANRVRQRAAGG